jgi:hypothetical protein
MSDKAPDGTDDPFPRMAEGSGNKPEPYPLEGSGAEAPGTGGPAPKPGQGRIEAPSILEAPAEEPCPRCRAPLAPDAVFCLKCGYDLRTAEVRTTETGVDLERPSPEELKKARPEFSPSDRGTVQTIAIAGAVMTIVAMICAAVFSPVARPAYVFGKVGLTLLDTLINTGTGIVAVAVAARLADMRLGRIDLLAAKVLLAFATFQTIALIALPGPPRLMALLMFLVAGAAYWALLMLLFGRSRMDALTVVVAHFILYFALAMASDLSSWLHRVRVEEEAKAAKFESSLPEKAPEPTGDPIPPGSKP